MGVDPRKLQKMMQKMGMQQQDLEASQVVIRLKDKELVFSHPSVSKVNVMGQETFQVAGDFVERQLLSFSEDDVKTVMGQVGVSGERAREALESSDGDIAKAILALSEGVDP